MSVIGSPEWLLEAAKSIGRRPSENAREKFWVSHFTFFLRRGYQLRLRYDPEWVPPWEVDPTKRPWNYAECLIGGGNFMDATRVVDGAKVMLKKVETRVMELPILSYLSTPKLRDDPRNHSLPLLDAILVPGDDDVVITVTPLLLLVDDLPFRRVGEVVELFQQFSETLELLHEHSIIHMDACIGNVMLDAEPLIPSGWHPAQWDTQDGLDKQIEWVDRSSKRPNKYYLIDYNLSIREEVRELAQYRGFWGQDRTVPEMSRIYFCDGFKVDVYQMGNSINYFIKKYNNLALLQPLADALTVKDPAQRPNAKQAASLIREFVRLVPNREMNQRIWRTGKYGPPFWMRILIEYFGYRFLF